MALSDLEKSKVLYYFGWPAKTLEITSTDYSKDVVDKLTTLPITAETLIRGMIGKADSLDDKLEKASSRALASKVGDIELAADEIQKLRGERNRVLRELSDFLDIEIVRQSSGSVSVVV